jgi:hypothetical protein
MAEHTSDRAVLQKPEEEHKERSFAVLPLCLDGHCEQFCEECRLPETVSFAHSLYLPFPFSNDLQLARKETSKEMPASFLIER